MIVRVVLYLDNGGPGKMTPEAFIAKWRASTLTEVAASQSHFIDLCALLEVPAPSDADLHGDEYTFEKNVLKLDGRPGRADVWKKGHFAWEYKGKKKNLVAAYSQLKEYADALENPPLLIVSDMEEIRVHTNFTNEVVEQTVLKIQDLNDPQVRTRLRYAFTDPERWRPVITEEGVTTQAAAAFAVIAQKLQAQGYDPRRVAHFLNKLVFGLFVEDIGLLPNHVFSDIVEESLKRGDEFVNMMTDLFRAMQEKNGRFGTTAIPWFNGGLFDDDDVLPLGWLEIRALADAARLDWSVIEPSIFGTLFERGLDPDKRKLMASLFDAAAEIPSSQAGLFDGHGADKGVGIHYTDPDTIMKIIEPVVLRPLVREWEQVKAEVAKHRTVKKTAKTDRDREKAEQAARDAYFAFRTRLGAFRVLDPACGSGNFLYLALHHLKDFDLQVLREANAIGLPLDDQRIGPDAVLGIEINPYAAELARVTIWIGELQWQLRNAFHITRAPILGRLDGIVCRDALLEPDGSETDWPAADAIVGNPPFLGDKYMIGALGEDYTRRLRRAFIDRVPGGADLVTYWFEKARHLLQLREVEKVGLVATNSVRGGANRKVLDRICETGAITDAWADEPWVVDGASVRVSLVCFSLKSDHGQYYLNGQEVPTIFPDLTGNGVNLTKSVRQASNCGVSFIGRQKDGPINVTGSVAREWLQLPRNPNGTFNSRVVHPWINGADIVRRRTDQWIVDFEEMGEHEAAHYEAPFEYVRQNVKPLREKNRDRQRRELWWRPGRSGEDMREALVKLRRFIVTPRVSKHRLFVWVTHGTVPDSATVAVARDDDTTFGILHSRLHELWSLRLCTWLGVGNDPRYTPSTTFETFPFPEGLTPDIPAADYADDPRAQAIAAAAKRLNELRENWLNPPELVKRVPEVVEGYPDRLLPVGEDAAKELKKRTLTNLYNARPAWLDNAHRDLDAAVAAAYGWPADLSDDEVLERLFQLNQERAAAQNSEKKS